MSDLVQRLRSKTPNMIAGHAAMEDAADMIETLQANCDTWKAIAKGSEAKLDEAITCLQRISWALSGDNGDMEAKALSYTTATLAKLKGKTDE
jgi:hypothetical protein